MSIKIKKLIAIFLLAINMVCISNFLFNYHSVSTAQNLSSKACSIDPVLANRMKVAYAQLENNGKGSINMGDRIDVAIRLDPTTDELEVDKSKVNPATVKDLKTAIDNELITPDRLILYLDKYPLKGTYSEPIRGIKRSLTNKETGEESEELNEGFRFLLKRTDESQASWNAILGGYPKLGINGIDVDVSLGCKDQLPLKSVIDNDSLSNVSYSVSNTITIFLHNILTVTFLVLSLIVFIVFFLNIEGLLKDYSEKNRGTFSLAKTQMAWWFFIILGSFLYTYVRTGDFTNTINSQAWILLGISATTGLSAVLIDNRKKPPSDGIAVTKTQVNSSGSSKSIKTFFQDLLTNNNQFSLHRYQIFVWTIFLGIIFIVEVLLNLEPPEFDPNLLTLQGISAGTYLGFKFPEQSKTPREGTDVEVSKNAPDTPPNS